MHERTLSSRIRKRVPEVLVLVGLAAGGGALALQSGDGQQSRPAAVVDAGTVYTSSSGPDANKHIPLFVDHRMTGADPTREQHCTIEIGQAPYARKIPGMVTIRLWNAPDMEEPKALRSDVEKIVGEIRDTRRPNSEPRVIYFEKAHAVTVEGSQKSTEPQWQAVTDMRPGIPYSLTLNIEEKGTGIIQKVEYPVVFWQKAA